jgi:hypothetical protein
MFGGSFIELSVSTPLPIKMVRHTNQIFTAKAIAISIDKIE